VVRALWERGLAGRGPTPRSGRTSSARQKLIACVLCGWGQFTTEVAPEVAPIMLLMRDASAPDPEVATLLRAADHQRRCRMRHNARRLQQRGWLRPGITLAMATDILWTYSSTQE
jgi:hypothetical protein